MPSDGPPLPVGVVGVGSLGFHHARILRDLPKVEMAGFWDVDEVRAREVAQELDVPARSGLSELLERCRAVVVAVPTSDHEAVAVAALERGVHTLVEKPLAPTLEAADRILEAAEEAELVLQTGHIERFNPAILAAEEHLERPLFVESHRLAPFNPRGTDVAVVLDLMIHDVDLVQSLVGTPIREVAATGVPVLTSSVDIANARLTFEGGAVANLTASRVSMKKQRQLRIFQPSGYLSLDLARGSGTFLRLKGELPALAGASGADAGIPSDLASLAEIVEQIPIAGDDAEPLRRELENFRDAVLGGSRPKVTGRDGREALAVALSIQDRIETHVADTRPT